MSTSISNNSQQTCRVRLCTQQEVLYANELLRKNQKMEEIADAISCCVTTPCFPCFLGLSNLNRQSRGDCMCWSFCCAATTCLLPVTSFMVVGCEYDQYVEDLTNCADNINKSCGIVPVDGQNVISPYEATDDCDNRVYTLCSGHFYRKRGICTEPTPPSQIAFLMPEEREFMRNIRIQGTPIDYTRANQMNFGLPPQQRMQ